MVLFLLFFKPDPLAIFSISSLCLFISSSSAFWCCEVLTAFAIAALPPARAPIAPRAAKSIGKKPPE
jgi:hypothetical protein